MKRDLSSFLLFEKLKKTDASAIGIKNYFPRAVRLCPPLGIRASVLPWPCLPLAPCAAKEERERKHNRRVPRLLMVPSLETPWKTFGVQRAQVYSSSSCRMIGELPGFLQEGMPGFVFDFTT